MAFTCIYTQHSDFSFLSTPIKITINFATLDFFFLNYFFKSIFTAINFLINQISALCTIAKRRIETVYSDCGAEYYDFVGNLDSIWVLVHSKKKMSWCGTSSHDSFFSSAPLDIHTIESSVDFISLLFYFCYFAFGKVNLLEHSLYTPYARTVTVRHTDGAQLCSVKSRYTFRLAICFTLSSVRFFFFILLLLWLSPRIFIAHSGITIME